MRHSGHPFDKTFFLSWLPTNKLSCFIFLSRCVPPLGLPWAPTFPLPLLAASLRSKPQREASSAHLFSYRFNQPIIWSCPYYLQNRSRIHVFPPTASTSANSLNFSLLEYRISLVSGAPLYSFAPQPPILHSAPRMIQNKWKHATAHLVK